MDDDVQQPVLTPNSLLQVNPCHLSEMETYQIECKDLKKRAKVLKRYKLAMWKRWNREYVRSLREQHRNLGRQNDQSFPKVGDVVVVQDGDQPPYRWRIAVVTRMIHGKDNVARGAVLKTGKGTLERAVQQLFPLELSCDREPCHPFNPNAPEYRPRTTRAAATEARERIRQIANEED